MEVVEAAVVAWPDVAAGQCQTHGRHQQDSRPGHLQVGRTPKYPGISSGGCMGLGAQGLIQDLGSALGVWARSLG